MSPHDAGFSLRPSGSGGPLRLLGLGLIAGLMGCYWNLGWDFALPFIGLIRPVVLAYLSVRALPRSSIGQQYAVFTAAAVFSETVRSVFYVALGHGLYYLVHESETHLAYAAIMADQLVMGGMTFAAIALLKRLRKSAEK